MRALWLSLTVLGVGACLPDGPSPTVTMPRLPAGTRVELHDVALVWPLPPGTGPASGEGFLGPVLGCDDLTVFEPLTRTDEPEVLCAALTVTAARLDPCTRLGGDSAVCDPQVRLVLQPVVDGEARDASIHAFFKVPEAEVARAVARLVALRLDAGFDGRGPLGVHPLLDDVAGRAAVARVIDDALATGTLDHFTQITVHGDDAAWTFEFRQFVDGAPTPGDALQQHVLSPDEAAIAVSVNPLNDHDDDFSVLLDDITLRAATTAEAQAALDAVARVEHPTIHDPGTVDCARCHLAAPARAAAFAARDDVVAGPATFTSDRHDLTPTAVFGHPQFIHAMAWRHRDLALNARVVHEAAVSADLLEAILTDLGALP
jgi:hypothetical protein